ncbi:MAG: exopolyphosphatase [Methyloprofundus sp.]|nr:exopolyphosphatase [Methyloprofundus sp.]
MTTTSEQKTAPELVAAVDLGSNSFHMIICSINDGSIKTIDRLKEMVRLASGLNRKNVLDQATQKRALACLERFGQRIQSFPKANVRIVGTNTLRTAKNAEQFIQKAEKAIGHPIHIISGIEEARLVYQGVAHSLQSNANRRFVMDIGGGSTEYIIGTNSTPGQKDSLRMGCVTVSHRFFAKGDISPVAFSRAVVFVNQQLRPYKSLFNHKNWDEAIGASGSIRAVRKVLLATEWSHGGITMEGLEKLKKHILSCQHISELDLPDLDPERLPVFVGGFAVLYATFKTLNISTMSVSDGALREGLIYDYLGSMFNHDVRSETVQLLSAHYHTDTEQAALIKSTALEMLTQLKPFIGPQYKVMAQYLSWAADLHEIGRNIAHSQYHKHGAYVIKNGDLAGFSQQNQDLLSVLVLAHRRKIPTKKLKKLPPPWNKEAIYMVILLRLAVILLRNRSDTALPDFKINLSHKKLSLAFPQGWLDEAPLTQADLQQEADYLKKIKYTLRLS